MKDSEVAKNISKRILEDTYLSHGSKNNIINEYRYYYQNNYPVASVIMPILPKQFSSTGDHLYMNADYGNTNS